MSPPKQVFAKVDKAFLVAMTIVLSLTLGSKTSLYDSLDFCDARKKRKRVLPLVEHQQATLQAESFEQTSFRS